MYLKVKTETNVVTGYVCSWRRR